MNISELRHPTDQLCFDLKTLLLKTLHQNSHRFVIVKNEKYNVEKKESHCVEDKKSTAGSHAIVLERLKKAWA